MRAYEETKRTRSRSNEALVRGRGEVEGGRLGGQDEEEWGCIAGICTIM